jgi:putative ABC transport system substrate-binding protein
VHRRLLLTLLAVTAVAHVAHARSSGQPPVVGYIGLSSRLAEERVVKAFQQAFHDMGYVEGRSLLIEYRWAEGSNERFGDLVADVMKLAPRVIVAPCGPPLTAIRARSKTMPVVVAACADIRNFMGEVATLARPGGYTTGFTMLAPEASGKRLELLKSLLPALSRVAVLHHAGADWSTYWTEMRKWARALQVTLHPFPIETAREIDAVFRAMARDRMDAVIVLPDPITFTHRAHIAELATKARMASAFDIRGFVVAGGLMSYGPDLVHQYARAAVYVDKILRGAKPGDLPIEQPSKFEFVINARTATSLGLTLPPSVRLLADQVIDP